jgi:plastocyanin
VIRGARLAVLTLILVAVGGCAASDSAGASPVATSAVDLPPSYRFAPEDIAVPAGTTVTWTNNDNFTHSVAFLDGGLPSEPLMMEPGQSAEFTFADPGVYRYQCHLHPRDMTGSVTVAP